MRVIRAKVNNGEVSVSPVFKWVGGKRQLLSSLSPMFPEDYTVYCEPFLGGGAVCFYLQPDKAVVNDINEELINAYEVIRDDVDSLIETLRGFTNDEECYYRVRNVDRDPVAYAALTSVERAARILYMNHTCFNGVYRVNSKGQFNVPFGRYKKPAIVNDVALRALHDYFNRADIRFCHGSYEQVLKDLPEGSFVYLDPPYDPVSPTASFTTYAKDGFSREDQIALREACDDLNRRGIKFMQSNSATPFILEQYKDYNITIVKANRYINRNGDSRGPVDEVVIRNYVNAGEVLDDMDVSDNVVDVGSVDDVVIVDSVEPADGIEPVEYVDDVEPMINVEPVANVEQKKRRGRKSKYSEDDPKRIVAVPMPMSVYESLVLIAEKRGIKVSEMLSMAAVGIVGCNDALNKSGYSF